MTIPVRDGVSRSPATSADDLAQLLAGGGAACADAAGSRTHPPSNLNIGTNHVTAKSERHPVTVD